MVTGLTSKMVLSLPSKNDTVFFIFIDLPYCIFKGATELSRHVLKENQEYAQGKLVWHDYTTAAFPRAERPCNISLKETFFKESIKQTTINPTGDRSSRDKKL